MIMILVNVLLAMVGGALVAGAIAWLSWTMLRWTGYPGVGPAIGFAVLALTLHSSDFTQMLILFSALLALGGLATLFGPGHSARRRKTVTHKMSAAPRV